VLIRMKRHKPKPPRPACLHEGPIIEHCKTCSGALSEWKHVRHCLHPDAEWDSCTRGRNKGVAQSCQTCEKYSEPSQLST
jgi:hypothetical protein